MTKTASEIKNIERLKRSHTELHRTIEKYQHFKETNVARRDIAKIINQLTNVLAEL